MDTKEYIYDEMEKHFSQLRTHPINASIEHFLETGKISGTFRTVIESYIPTPPTRTVTDAEIEREVLQRYPSVCLDWDVGGAFEKRQGFRDCIEWMRDKAINRTALPKEGWISVEDRLPENQQWILVIDEHNNYYTGYMDDGEWILDDDTYKIIYWQPLPKPPITDTTQEITTKN